MCIQSQNYPKPCSAFIFIIQCFQYQWSSIYGTLGSWAQRRKKKGKREKKKHTSSLKLFNEADLPQNAK